MCIRDRYFTDAKQAFEAAMSYQDQRKQEDFLTDGMAVSYTHLIQPSVDFLHLEEVMIVKEKTADQSQGEAQQQGTGGQE